MNRNEIKKQISERLMTSIEIAGDLNFVINLTSGLYVAAVVKSIERDQFEFVGLSTPDCDRKEIEMVGDVMVEMLEKGEIGEMIKSIAPKQVVIAPYEGFNHRKFLFDYMMFNINDNLDVYFENEVAA